MVDSSVFPKLAKHAELNGNDIVLDAGAGFGFLTRFLATQCKQVIAVEKDPRVSRVLREQLRSVPNVTVVEGDMLTVDIPEFSKAVCVPPYYLSSQLVTWLIDHRFTLAVLVLQREFAQRLVAVVGTEEYGWLRVVSCRRVQAELLEAVLKWMFHPRPEVDSVIVRLRPWAKLPFTVRDEALFRRLARWLFTQRNKKLSNALVPFIKTERGVSKAEAAEIAARLPFGDRRARNLSPENFGAIADALTD